MHSSVQMYEKRGLVRSCWPRIHSELLRYSPVSGLIFLQAPNWPWLRAWFRRLIP
jgi:hypothetical protein